MASRTTEWRRNNPEKNAILRSREVPNPEALRRAKQTFRMRHLERVRKENAEAQRRRREKPGVYIAIKAKMRLSYAEKRELEAGRPRSDHCEICGSSNRIVFDHCHASGQFRGWICDTCNKILGMVKDNPETLRKLSDYLENNNVEANVKS